MGFLQYPGDDFWKEMYVSSTINSDKYVSVGLFQI